MPSSATSPIAPNTSPTRIAGRVRRAASSREDADRDERRRRDASCATMRRRATRRAARRDSSSARRVRRTADRRGDPARERSRDELEPILAPEQLRAVDDERRHAEHAGGSRAARSRRRAPASTRGSWVRRPTPPGSPAPVDDRAQRRRILEVALLGPHRAAERDRERRRRARRSRRRRARTAAARSIVRCGNFAGSANGTPHQRAQRAISSADVALLRRAASRTAARRPCRSRGTARRAGSARSRGATPVAASAGAGSARGTRTGSRRRSRRRASPGRAARPRPRTAAARPAAARVGIPAGEHRLDPRRCDPGPRSAAASARRGAPTPARRRCRARSPRRCARAARP